MVQHATIPPIQQPKGCFSLVKILAPQASSLSTLMKGSESAGFRSIRKVPLDIKRMRFTAETGQKPNKARTKQVTVKPF